jgi:uncharacterized protein
MTKLSAALRQKFPTPQAAMEALGLDAALLDDTEEDNRMKLSTAAVAAFKSALAPKLAMDANIEEIMPLIETLVEGMSSGNGNGEEMADQASMTTAPSSAVPVSSTLDAPDGWDEEETEEEKKAADARRAVRAADARRRLGRDETDEEKDKREGEDSAADARERLGRDETPEECAARQAKDARRRAKDERAIIPSAKDQVVTKKALDVAMATARRLGADDAIRMQREIRAAERAVRPYVGDLALALDSAEAVYRTALTMLGVKTEGIHPSAFATILAMQPHPGARPPVVVALDSAGAKGFAERFPDALRVNVI